MIPRIGLVLAVVLLSACPKIFLDDKMFVMWSDPTENQAGEAVRVHPAVIEFLFATTDSPWGKYYAAAARQDKPPAELRRLDEDARAIAGSVAPAAADYARARARRLAPVFNRAFMAGKGDQWAGYVTVRSRTFTNKNTRRATGGWETWFVSVHRSAQVLKLVRKGKPLVYLAWDLQFVPGAFDLDADLDYATVARAIRPLHGSGDWR